MNTGVPDEWRRRYRKQIILRELGLRGQGRIGEGSVLVIGAGGLGGIVSILLVRAGVGRVRIVDSDVVQEENLHRQLLFTEAHAANRIPKAEAAASVLGAINAGVEVEGVVGRVTAHTLPSFLEGMRVVVDATDNWGTRDLINSVGRKTGTRGVHGGILGTSGAVLTVVPDEGPCLRCLYPSLPGPDSPHSPDVVGILNTIPALVGTLQATEALRLLVGEPPRQCWLT